MKENTTRNGVFCSIFLRPTRKSNNSLYYFRPGRPANAFPPPQSSGWNLAFSGPGERKITAGRKGVFPNPRAEIENHGQVTSTDRKTELYICDGEKLFAQITMKWSLFCGRLSSTCWIVVDCCVDLMMLSFCWWCWCNLIVKQAMSNQIVEMPNCVWSIDFLMKCLKYFWCAVLCWFSRCLLWCYDVECYELAKSQKWLQMNFVWRKDSAENFERIVGGKKWWYFCAIQMCWFLMFATRGLVSVELLNLRLVDWFFANL